MGHIMKNGQGQIQSERPERSKEQLHDPDFVKHLFDSMSETYGTVNYVSSLGFTERWRRQCLNHVDVNHGDVVLDLMTGMGELFPHLKREGNDLLDVFAVDISSAMCQQAKETGDRFGDEDTQFQVVRMNALQTGIKSSSIDVVVSSFGLKTFSERQIHRLAETVHSLLKPGGQYAMVEISVPSPPLIQIPYLVYIHYLIPLIGIVCLGNPADYRLLGTYTESFGSCAWCKPIFREHGLTAEVTPYFFGCMTALHGRHPK